MKEIKGDLIELAKQGKFDVIAHGCNCQCTMKAGIAVGMAREFRAHEFPMERTGRGDYNKLGQIDYKEIVLTLTGLHFHDLIVVNAYTQFNYGRNHLDGDKIPLDYDALSLCLKKINHEFKGKHIGLPLIGAGLAGGKWLIIKQMIKDYLKDMDVTIVHFDDKYFK